MSNARRVNGYWNDVIIPRAEEIIDSYSTRVTLRQLFYRLVSEELIRNTVSEYSQLSRRTAALRRNRLFPELMDAGRGIVATPSWDGPEEAREAIRDQYRRDRTEGQEHCLCLGVEKAGLVAQLEEWFGEPFGIPIIPLGGYESESFDREINDHLEGDGRRSVLLYVGDLDPSGEDIERNLREWTKFDVYTRIALTTEQVEEYSLPHLPGKTGDTRNEGFRARHGKLFQVEVDALDPNVLRELFQTAIDEFFDNAIYEKVLRREKRERRQL